MQTAITFLKFVAALLGAVLTISLGIWIWGNGSATAKNVGNKQTQIGLDIANSTKTRYDGLIVNGADVVNAINDLKSDGIKLSVVVKVKDGSTVVDRTISDFSDFINLPSDELYINPYAKFLGKVIQNENGVITGLSFSQREYVSKAVAVNDDDFDSGTGEGTGTTNNDLKQSLEAFTVVANDLTTAVSGLQQAIADIRTSGGGSSGGINSSDMYVLKDSISTLNTTVNDIKQFCDEFDMNHGVDLSEVTSQLSQIQENLSQLNVNTGVTADDIQYAINTSETIAGLLTAVDDLGGVLGTLSEEIDNIEFTLNGEINGDSTVTPGLVDDVSDLQGQVSELKAQLSEMKEVLDYLVTVVGGDN